MYQKIAATSLAIAALVACAQRPPSATETANAIREVGAERIPTPRPLSFEGVLLSEDPRASRFRIALADCAQENISFYRDVPRGGVQRHGNPGATIARNDRYDFIAAMWGQVTVDDSDNVNGYQVRANNWLYESAGDYGSSRIATAVTSLRYALQSDGTLLRTFERRPIENFSRINDETADDIQWARSIDSRFGYTGVFTSDRAVEMDRCMERITRATVIVAGARPRVTAAFTSENGNIGMQVNMQIPTPRPLPQTIPTPRPLPKG